MILGLQKKPVMILQEIEYLANRRTMTLLLLLFMSGYISKEQVPFGIVIVCGVYFLAALAKVIEEK